MTLTRIGGETAVDPKELIALDSIKAQLRIGGSPSDNEIKRILGESVSFVEGETGLALAKGQWKATYTNFPERSPLVFPGLLASVADAAQIAYVEKTGGGVTHIDFTGTLVEPRGDLFILPSEESYWPSFYRLRSIEVLGSRGVDIGKLPGDLQSAVLLQMSQVFDGFDQRRSRAIRDICRRYK